MRDFRDLKVWQKAYALTLAVYRASTSFPRDRLAADVTEVKRMLTSFIQKLKADS